MHLSVGKLCISIALLGPALQGLAAQTPKPSSPALSQRKVFEVPLEEQKADILIARGQYAASHRSLRSAQLLLGHRVEQNRHGVPPPLCPGRGAQGVLPGALKSTPVLLRQPTISPPSITRSMTLPKAEHYYKKALKYTSEDAVIYCNLGTAYFAEKKYAKGKKGIPQGVHSRLQCFFA